MWLVQRARRLFMRCRLKKAQRHLSEQALNRYCSVLNWPYASAALLAQLTDVADELNSNQSIYRFVADKIDDHKKGVYQVILRAHRKGLVPRFKIERQGDTSSEPAQCSPYESEKPSSLIFSRTNAGLVIVSAYPHSSSNHEVSQNQPYVLAAYNDCEKLRKDVVSYRVLSLVYAYLDLQRVSSFDCMPTHESKRILRRLASRADKKLDLFQEDRERRIENHRIDWTLGTGAVAALFAVMPQSVGAFFDDLQAGRSISLMPVLLTAIPALVLLFTLKKIANR